MNARQVIFALIAVATLASCHRGTADAAALATADIHGTYAHGHSRPAREEYLRIEDGRITKIVICRDGEDMDTLQVSAPARVTERTFEIEHPALEVRRVGNVDCVARLDRGSIDYHVDRYHTLTLHPHFGGWRKHYVLVGAERPGLWAELRHDAAEFRRHLKRFGSRVRRVLRKGADEYVGYKMQQAQMNVEMIERAFDGASKLSRQLKPAPRGENE